MYPSLPSNPEIISAIVCCNDSYSRAHLGKGHTETNGNSPANSTSFVRVRIFKFILLLQKKHDGLDHIPNPDDPDWVSKAKNITDLSASAITMRSLANKLSAVESRLDSSEKVVS